MAIILNYKKYLILSAIVFLFLFWPQGLVWLKLSLLIIWLLISATLLSRYLKHKSELLGGLAWGAPMLLSVIVISQTLFFYFNQINYFSTLLALAIIFLLSLWVSYKSPQPIELPNIFLKTTWLSLSLLIIYGYFFIQQLQILITSSSDISLRSPWTVIDSTFFIYYFLNSLIVIGLAIINSSKFRWLTISAHFLLSLSLAVIIYKLGYEFDSFIHRLNLQLIIDQGTIWPKPWYYIGHYSLETFTYYLTGLSLDSLNTFLVPILASCLIPLVALATFKQISNLKNYSLAVIGLLLIPFTFFTSSTPQGLANLFIFILLLLSLKLHHRPEAYSWPLWLIALATLAIHPMAGIPALIFVAIFTLNHNFQEKLPPRLRQTILIELVTLGALALPTAFIINSQTLSQLKVSLNFNWLTNLGDLLLKQSPIFYRHYITIYDFIYTYGYNLALAIIGLAILSFFITKQQKKLTHYLSYWQFGLVLLISYLLIKFSIDFFSLAQNEKMFYPQRILDLLMLVGIILAWPALEYLIDKINQTSWLHRLIIIILISCGLTTSVYLTYPRVDTIAENHGYSTSATDLKTVQFIDRIQKNEPYVVLASQPVSAAAIKSFGFNHYYNGFYYYPVPTGNQLYKLYLDLAYNREDIKDVVATARYFTGVKTIFFVINDYWDSSAEIIKTHQETSDEYYSIDNKNSIFIYRY